MKAQRIYFIIAFSILSFLFIFRVKDSPADYYSYIEIFKYSDDIVYQGEYGFWLLIRIYNFFNLNAEFFMASVPFIILIIYFYAAKRTGIHGCLVLFFLSAPSFLLFAVNGLRQGLAMAILLLALRYRGVKLYILLMFSASFHTSSIVVSLIGLTIFYFDKFIKLNVFLYPFAAAIFSLLMSDMLNYSATYASYYDVYYGNKEVFYLRLTVYLAGFLIISKMLMSDNSFKILDSFIISSLSIGILTINNELFSSRFLYYAEVFLYLRMILSCKIKEDLSFVFFLFSILFFIMFLNYPSVHIQYFN
jgi:hypothetical protein